MDATGKFLIPGRGTCTCIGFSKTTFRSSVANGVTGARLMWGMPMHQQWRKNTRTGRSSARDLSLPAPLWTALIQCARLGLVKDDREARQAVTRARQERRDFIKVYSRLTREAFFAIADETKKQGIPFAGHNPQSVTVAEASDAGQKSIEHLTGILTACSSREEEMRKETAAAVLRGQRPNPANSRQLTRSMLETFSAEKAASLFARFKRNQTWQCPTLTVLRSIASLDDPKLRVIHA